MKYGLIGEKLGHSFSKPIHEKIGGYEYELRELEKADLASFMKQKSFLGINVTIPYKSAVMPYLDYIEPTAEKIGAVNTVVNRDGKLYGYNTDFGGMRMLILKQGFDYRDKKVLILGSGGTSKTASAVAQSLGAASTVTVSRKGDVNYENVYALHGDADYIINTTPVGMYPDNFSSPVDLTLFSKLKGVTDVVYNPLRTRLCLEAEEKGIACSCGLYMLVSQAVLACEYFTGETLEKEKLTDEIFIKMKAQKQNVVLIGMPGSGKSTIGKLIGEKTGREFIDTDEMIVEKYGDISKIFAEKGESYFRTAEEEAVKKASQKIGAVIATGGGAVLKAENIRALKQNGVIFFLNRPLCDIVPTDDRPLSSNYEALKKRFEERYSLYLSSADYEIHIDGNAENAAAKITEIMK